MLKKFLAISAAAIAACAALSGCGTNAYARYRRTFASFGAMATVYLDGEFSSDEQRQDAIDTAEEIGAILTSFENTFSTTIEDSDVCLFNAAAPGSTVGISEDMYNVLSLALEMYDETGGYYNAGVYYSVDLYNFAARPEGVTMPYDREENSDLPDERYVAAFCELSKSFSKIELYAEGGSYYAVKPEDTVEVDGVIYSLAIDLSGIAKGYTVDIVDKYIEDAGYPNSSFSYGMSSIAVNSTLATDSGEWYLTFRDPRGTVDDYYMAIDVKDACISTSGDYENYYEVGDRRYCHIIDPDTGSPINTGIVTSSCIGGTAAEDDARTTAVMAMGLDGVIEYINSQTVKEQGLRITFVYQNSAGEYLLVTNIPEGEYELLNSVYIPASRIDENGNVVFTGTR